MQIGCFHEVIYSQLSRSLRFIVLYIPTRTSNWRHNCQTIWGQDGSRMWSKWLQLWFPCIGLFTDRHSVRVLGRFL